MTAGLAASTGMSRYLKTLLGNVPGVQFRLVSVVQNLATNTSPGSWTIICGGGDPYQVAYAIYFSDFYIPGLTGSVISVAGITNANPIVVTTANNHNLLSGDVETITGVVGMLGVNNNPQVVTVTGPKTFTMPIDASATGKYISGGIVSPNPANNYVTITDYPDNYVIPYVIPAQETVKIDAFWGTDSPNYVSAAAMAQAAGPAIVDYVNSLPAGTSPINLNVLTQVFIEAVISVLGGEAITYLAFNIYINQIETPVSPGTQCVFGDPFSYFYTTLGSVTVSESI
jgi:hypothetical protein